jgi:hypothetical protein
MHRKTYLPPSLRYSALALEHALLGKSSRASAEKAHYERGFWEDETDENN